MRPSQVVNRSSRMWMRSSLVVRASDCQCGSRNSPGFHPSILRHSGTADEIVLNSVQKKPDDFICAGIVVVYGVHDRHLGNSGFSCSFVEQTRVLSLVGEEVEETEIPGPVYTFSILIRDQCCGSGSGIRCPLTPGSGIRGMGKKSGPDHV
jgi:hypothetical protein